MDKSSVGYLCLFLGLVMSFSAPANGADRWSVAVQGVTSESSAELIPGEQDVMMVDMESGSGLGLQVEYLLNERWRTGISYAKVDLDANFSNSPAPNTINVRFSQRLDLEIYTLSLGLDLLPDRKLDLVIAPTISYVQFGKGDAFQYAYDSGVRVEWLDLDADTAWGASLGLDIPLGSRGWLLSSGLRYVAAQAAGEDLDTLVIALGVGCHL